MSIGSGLGLRWLRHEGLGDVVQIRGRSFHPLEGRITFTIVVIDVGNENKIIYLNDQMDGLGLAFRVADRISTRPGSAFETEYGDGYDYVLVTNILHHFDEPGCEKLMRRVQAALKPGGKAITLEFVPNAFSLVMLANTDAGQAYTLSEYQKMFANSGFKSTTLHQVPDMPNQILVSEK